MTRNDQFKGVRAENEAIEALNTANQPQPECPVCASKSVKDTLWFMFVLSIIASLVATAIWAGGNYLLSNGKPGTVTDDANAPVTVQIGVMAQHDEDVAVPGAASNPH